MISLGVLISLVILWLFSAFILTLGLYLLGKLMDWRTEEGFWSPFPTALAATLIITLANWGLGFVRIPLFTWLAKIAVWCMVVMKAFDIEFLEAVILSIILFFLKLLFTVFVLSFIMSLVF